jgi:hypothetical protein
MSDGSTVRKEVEEVLREIADIRVGFDDGMKKLRKRQAGAIEKAIKTVDKTKIRKVRRDLDGLYGR